MSTYGSSQLSQVRLLKKSFPVTNKVAKQGQGPLFWSWAQVSPAANISSCFWDDIDPHKVSSLCLPPYFLLLPHYTIHTHTHSHRRLGGWEAVMLKNDNLIIEYSAFGGHQASVPGKASFFSTYLYMLSFLKRRYIIISVCDYVRNPNVYILKVLMPYHWYKI